MSKVTRTKDKMFFWLDGWDGEARGGFFLRNSLKLFFDKLKDNGLKPVGIKYDGTYNLEIIVERNKSFIENYEQKSDSPKDSD